MQTIGVLAIEGAKKFVRTFRPTTVGISSEKFWSAIVRCLTVIRDLQIEVRVRDLVRVRLFKPSVHAFDLYISHQRSTDNLLFNWSATGRSVSELWKRN